MRVCGFEWQAPVYNKMSMLHNLRQGRGLSLFYCLLLLGLVTVCEGRYVSLNVQTSSTQINQPSNYSFTINRQYDPVNIKYNLTVQAVPPNTAIVITLPSQFVTISTASTLSCINAANSQTLTCNVNVPAKTITVTDYYASNSTLSNGVILFNVFNMINAYKAGASDNFYWQIVAPNGTTIDAGPVSSNTQVSTSLTFTPGTFSSCSISANQASVSSYSPITLTIVPADPIPVSGQLVVVIPQTWSSDPLLTSTINASPSCTGVTNTGASVSCSYTFSQTSQVITVYSLSTASLSSQFSIKIANVLIPPTVGSSETISMYSQWSDGTEIDTCTPTISDIAYVPFQTATLTSNDNTTVQSSFTASLQLTISRGFYYQDSIELILPNEFLNCHITSTTFTTFTTTANINSLTLTNFPSTTQSITSNNILAFTISSISNPLTTASISLTASVYRNNQLYQKSILTYKATVGSLDSVVISPESSFVQQSGKATITLTSSLLFPVGSTINIVYPLSITAATVSTSSVTLATINGSVITGANYQVASNQIKFTNIFASKVSGTIVLIIGSFTNPPTVQPTNYLIQVYDSTGAAIMTGSTSITAITKAFINNTITASSYQVLKSSVIYTATIVTNFGFTSVTIIVPSDITIGSGYSYTCASASFSSCSLSGNNLTFFTPSALSAGSYQLQFGSVTNPNSFATTSSFQIYSYSNGYGVENSQGLLNIAMNTPCPFSTPILTPSSYLNSATISITLMLTFPSNAPAGQFAITVPSEVAITSASCTGCTVSSPYIYIALSAGTSNLTVVINNIKNVGSSKPVGSFTVTLTSAAGYASLSSSVAGWINDKTSSFNTNVAGNNNHKGEANSFTFALSGLSGSQTYAVIGFDSSFGALTTAPTGFTLVNSNTLQVGCMGTSCNFDFSITNPTANGSFVFSVSTYSSENYTVGTSTSNAWLFDCYTTNCHSCTVSGGCTKCYNSSISNYYILNTFTSSCDMDCLSGYFRINTTCTICNTNCTQCVNTSKTCTSCATGYYLDTIYAVCVPKCSSGYFANDLSQTCTACTQPCSTCSSPSTYCLSCITNTYLFNNSCLSTCPLHYYIANVVTLKCDPCNSNCLTCANTITFCLSCNNTNSLYFENNVCVGTCSSNYFLINNICTYCQQPCKICSGSIDICSSCFINSSNPIYYNHTCVSTNQCPVGYYVNSTNSSCEVCPSSCIVCSSSTVCSVCSLNYYLFGTLCISTCPNTTYSTSNSSTGLCQACNGCLTCSSSSACTSCIASQYLYNAVCYSSCPNGSYAVGSICSACAGSCPTCQNVTYCTSCVTSMNLYKGGCYLTCPNSTFANTTSQLCVACPASCSTCTAPSSCQTCVGNYSLENSQCVLMCSLGLSYQQICYPCGLNCDICQNGTCLRCSSSYFLYNNTCLNQCPGNMLTLDTINCVPCTQKFTNCSTCSFTACLSCTYGQLTSNGTCVPCSPGTYAQSSACTNCPSTCATCDSQINCTTCKTGNYMLTNQCMSACPLNMIPSGTNCISCLENCNICNQANFLCSVCTAGYYLYNNLCFTSCPADLVVSYDFLTCVTKEVYFQQFSKAAKIVPFPFTIATVALIIIGIALKCFHREMHLQTVLCAIISIIETATWVIFLFFEYTFYSNFHQLSFYNMICSVVGVALLAVMHAVHLRFYCKYIRDDQEFTKWVRKNGCANGAMLTVATLLNFKFYRFVHSKFLGRDETSMLLSSPNKLIPFSLISVISIFTSSIPLFVGCALALYNSIAQDQQFFIALDTITVTSIMILLLLMDLRHPDDYFVDEHEAKNLKKKVYQEDEVRFQEAYGNPMEDNVSHEQLMQIQEDQGDMALPPSATKFQSTFQKTAPKMPEVTHLAAESKVAEEYEVGSQENICEQEESEQSVKPSEGKVKWAEKKYDHHGYLIKYDASNNPIRYDENGHRVEIGEDGKHRKYNQEGHQMLMVDGKLVPHDQDGFRIINGNRYDHRGYQIMQQDGQLVAYDANGFKVVGEPPNQKHIDENGNEVIPDEDGKLRHYQQDGWEVVEVEGKTLLKNKLGQCMRKNSQGQWQAYDPKDGFTLRINPNTGQFDKYNDLGFRVVKDKYGNLHYYDEDDFKVTILPGGEVIRHDAKNYRVEKDEQGKIHRFDEEGFELVQDEKGNPMFIDKNGYRVERDLYGRVTLYDKEGLEVRIDPETGQHRRFNEQGLEVVTDAWGNRKLVDKRGRIVKELQETYQKYDSEGNKIWLDEYGYEVQEDDDGRVNRYDKVGDRVDTEYEIEEFDQPSGNLMMNTIKTQPPRYRYKPTRETDQEAELNQLISAPQLVAFEEQDEEISELEEFHHADFPPERDVTHEFDRIVDKQRSELVFREQAEEGLDDLREFERKEELWGHLLEPNTDLEGLLPPNGGCANEGLPQEGLEQAQLDGQLAMRALGGDMPTGLSALPANGNRTLEDHELDRQAEFDQEFALRGLDGNVPAINRQPLQGNMGLAEREVQQGELDQKFTVQELDAREPVLNNRALDGHRQLGDRESGRQGQYDQEAYVREIDDNEPDVLEIRRRDAERAEMARRKAEGRSLGGSRVQEEIDIRSVADVSIAERSFENQGVQPLQNRTDYDEINSLDEMEVPLGRRGRGNRSEVSLVNGRKDTQTVYNYNTVQVEIKNQNPLYDEEEEIESLHEEDWQEQLNPMLFSRRVKEHPTSSNANTNAGILYLDDPDNDHQDAPNDALSDLLQHSENKHRTHRYRPSEVPSRESIDQFEEQLFRQARPQRERERQIRERRQFRLSGAPNPLVEYAKTIEANKKSLQEKMYLQQNYKQH